MDRGGQAAAFGLRRSRRHRHPSRALLIAALFVLSCGGPSREREAPPAPPAPAFGSRSLVTDLHVAADPGAPSTVGEGPLALDLRNLARVAIGDSEREAVATTSGVRWETHVELPPNATLSFAVASRGAPATAVMRVVRGGESRELFRAALAADAAWTEQRVEVVNAASIVGDLMLESDAPVVWSELYVRPVEIEARGPNLVLVIIDTLRADHVGFMGYSRTTTPNLDRLTDESFVFREARSASSWTLPSTASMLTGLFPAQHGVKLVSNRLAPSIVTLAERLRVKGYRTAAFTDGGFVGPEWGFNQGFERYDATPGPSWIPKDLEHGFDVARVVAGASKWIAAEPGRPYFLLVHTYEPHEPYGNVEGFADPFLSPDIKGKARTYGHVGALDGPVNAVELTRLQALYDGGVARADHYIGRFLDALRQRDDWQSTAVIVTSDHGEEFQEHGSLAHGLGKVFEEDVHVPLVVKPPGTMTRRDVDLPVSGVDLVPTFLEWAGIAADASLPGRSLIDIVAENVRRPVLMEGFNTYPSLNESRARLDRGSRALVVDRVRREEAVYDLGVDRGMNDPRPLAADEPIGDQLQAILAWTSRGELAVRLPAGVRSIEIPAGSRVAPVGVWRRFAFTPVKGNGPIDLGGEPPGPTVLVFDPGAGQGDWQAMLHVGDEASSTVTFRRRTAAGQSSLDWRPLDGDPPLVLDLYRTARPYELRSSPLTPEEEAKLKALGYLEP